MVNEAEKSNLWRRAFSPQGSSHEKARERLRGSLERMREQVAALITTIPADCRELTVHDVTHLDALWEIASVIAGEEFDINPAEAFVLGGAILLHDAGLSAAAYPGGLEQIKKTSTWQDVASAMLRQFDVEPTPESIQAPPSELLDQIKFEVLRELHAQQAERLATSAWPHPGGGQFYLLDDTELRDSFGAAIGRVAHSHHWSVERVATTLLDHVGSGTVLPFEWSLSERKVACVLRCADAGHIDRRRAPTILFAAMQPRGMSRAHWGAQNKINKPTVNGSTLIYSAGQSFKPEDAASWWLAYDLVRLVDKEIRATNALLEELKFTPLLVQRVLGADNPREFSTYVRPEGWRPIDAEIRVSDPVHLAQMLGGHHLYGKDYTVPIRELLQNCADAIRARRALEGRPSSWGKIHVCIESVPGEPDACWLHVDDDGIGMSERVLSGPLVDFGKSIWNSSLLREEFPGLQAKNVQTIGKFGIGFFSVFELGSCVRVVSRQFSAALSDAKVLEFQSLTRRPLIRAAEPSELPQDYSTRISVKIEDRSKTFPNFTIVSIHRGEERNKSLESVLRRMVAMLDVSVEYTNNIDGTNFVHSADIYGVSPESFLGGLMPDIAQEPAGRQRAYFELLAPLEGENGAKHGRAALLMIPASRRRRVLSGKGFVSVGGIVYQSGAGMPVPYIGVVEGQTEEAARRSAQSMVPREVLGLWATRQARLIDPAKFSKDELMTAAHSVILAGGDPGSLPYCFRQNSLVDYRAAVAAIYACREIKVALLLSDFDTEIHSDFDSEISVLSYSELTHEFFDTPMRPEVFVLAESETNIVSQELANSLKQVARAEISLADLSLEPDGSLSVFLDAVSTAWNCEPDLTFEMAQIFDADLYSPQEPGLVLSLKAN